jgi:hypothetical protein
MNLELSRRDLLMAMSLGLTAAPLFGAATAGPVCMTMIYFNNPNLKFDFGRYRDQHLPLFKRTMGDSVERIELRTVPRQERGAPVMPSAVFADVSVWIRNLETFAAATKRGGDEIKADLASVTKSSPVLQYDQVIGEWGQPRDSVGVGLDSQALYYPNGDGAKWDADYYLNNYLPRMVEAYGGDKALRRIEVRRGIGVQGGGKPAVINSVHLYASDNSGFAMGGMRAGQQLMSNTKPFTTIIPHVANLKVQATG